MRVRPFRITTIAISAAAAMGAPAAPRPLALRHVGLSLPGPPAAIVSVDLDHDGRKDLLVVVAFTRWGSIAQDRVEDAVAVTEVVPALFDRREAHGFLARSDGTFTALPALELPTTVIGVEAGTPAHPVVALTDDGLAELRLGGSAGSETLTLEPLLSARPAFAGSGAFLADPGILQDVDGDGRLDAVIAGIGGIAIHRGTEAGGFAAEASFSARLPGDLRSALGTAASRNIPVPTFEDVDGDKTPDLVIRELDGWPQSLVVAKGLGAGRFAPPKRVALACLATAPQPRARRARDGDGGPPVAPLRVAWFGDLDANGHGDIVTREGIDTGKSDSKQAKSPSMRYRVFRLRPDLTVDPTPAQTFEAIGYAFSGALGDATDLEFIDLDGDHRKDLVTITIDFSVFQVLRALTAKKIGIGLEFHVVGQQQDGSFRLVAGQTLDEKLNLDLNHLEISRLGQFQGDFDGDGRTDFVHLGRGKTITIHRGEAGGRYPDKPDLAIALDQEPEDVMLVRVRDLDGDGRSDLAITRTGGTEDQRASAPVVLELYLSGEPK
jgi:hypothetical protein